MQLSSKTSIESSGHAQNKGFANVGTLPPGQIPKNGNLIHHSCFDSGPTVSKISFGMCSMPT